MKFGYLDKFERHETPVGEYHPHIQGRKHQPYSDHRVPVNMYQALMEAAPYDDVPMTEQEREQDWEGFQQKLESANLTAREQLTFDCIAFGGMSLSKVAAVIAATEGLNRAPSKMQVSRYRDRAYDKLRTAFTQKES